MSMNLGCTEFNLGVSTPTWITKMILSRDRHGRQDGGYMGVATRYLIWLRHERDCCCCDEDGKLWVERIYIAEVAISQAIAQGSELHFWEE